MSKVLFSSDWHFGHNNIHKFRCKNRGFKFDFNDEKEHRDWLVDEIKSIVCKRDVLYLLGDIATNENVLLEVGKLPGRKILVKGNHDVVKNIYEHKVYDRILGISKYKNNWISHSPIHPKELYNLKCLHGHMHDTMLVDRNYFSCCVENLMQLFDKPIASFDEIMEVMNGRVRN